MNDSSELNVVIGVAGDVGRDCWRYENSKGGTGSDVLDSDISDGSWTKGSSLFLIS